MFKRFLQSKLSHSLYDTSDSPLIIDAYERITASVLAILGVLMGATIILSNLMATKLWALGPFPLPGILATLFHTSTFRIRLDGGFILFPLSYVLGDVLVELYHEKLANHIAYWACAANVVGCLLFRIVDLLPALPGTSDISLSAAFGLSSRIMLASTVGFILNTRVNNRVYAILQSFTPPEHIGIRSWISSFLARIVDTVSFTLIAFLGELTLGSCFYQMLGSFAAGMIVETAMIPITVITVVKLRKFISDYDTDPLANNYDV